MHAGHRIHNFNWYDLTGLSTDSFRVDSGTGHLGKNGAIIGNCLFGKFSMHTKRTLVTGIPYPTYTVEIFHVNRCWERHTKIVTSKRHQEQHLITILTPLASLLPERWHAEQQQLLVGRQQQRQ